VVLDHPELVEATGDEMIYSSTGTAASASSMRWMADHRGRHGYPGGRSGRGLRRAEVDYILEAMRMAFPAIRVDRSHVVFRFCGVRPLPRSNALTPGQISRDHSYPVLAPGNGIDFPIYSLVGGKWTTFRALAEKVCDEILRVLGRRRIRVSADVPIGAARATPECRRAAAASGEARLLWWCAMARGRTNRRLLTGGPGCAARLSRRLLRGRSNS